MLGQIKIEYVIDNVWMAKFKPEVSGAAPFVIVGVGT